MSSLLCFKCRRPIGGQSPYCSQCGTSYSSGEEDPEAISAEREFLLDRALELSDVASPSFSGFPEEELLWRAQRRPTLPLGRPADYQLEGLEREALQSRLESPDGWERAMAALQLAQFNDPESLFALLRHLGDRDVDVRTCILWSLGQAASPLTLPPLLEFSRLEADALVRGQLAATLFSIVVTAGRDRGQDPKPLLNSEELATLDSQLLVEPSSKGYFDRGRLMVKSGHYLKAIGSFSRALEGAGDASPRPLLYRSQGFLLMGKPLYALDDLLVCPEDYDYPPMYYLHRAALITLGRQIASAARDKGLVDYARLFERRLDHMGRKRANTTE